MAVHLTPLRSLSFLISFLSALSVMGCAGTRQGPVLPTSATATGSSPIAQINSMLASAAINGSPVFEDYRLGPEDTVQVTIFNVEGATGGGLTPREVTLRVSQQGIIKLPLLGEVRVAGLTVG